jgi:NAD(P)-dependent dehydrogenase (short-subunit alcohol dehydrogenase family)
MSSITGKVALITGASRGIGEATARILSKAGVRVVLAARSEKELSKLALEIEQAGGSAASVLCDVSKEEDVKKAVEFAESKYGRLDFIFSNAGWEGPMNTFIHEMKGEDISKMFDVNVLASIFLIKYAVPVLRKNGGGVFVFNSSLGAVCGADAGRLPTGLALYSVTKAALDHLVRMMASYEKENIKGYSVLPAVFSTAMIDGILKGDGPQGMLITTQDAFANFNPKYKGKAGDPRHVGELVLSLFDGSTKYQSSDSILIDHDVTWNAHEFYKVLCLPGLPQEQPNARNLLGELL